MEPGYLQQHIGEIGEAIAAKHLKKHGYRMLECNFSGGYGEIDIICSKRRTVHFVEVKAQTFKSIEAVHEHISHGTIGPEDRVDAKKLWHLQNTIIEWKHERQYYGNHQVDIAAVLLVPYETHAVVRIIEDIDSV